ncbi:MAG: T9SS type A sorting domain-containing protein [Bacteroidales bacterium]|nr:T9SS type A sorting domain-containing protein [Bacteroidales bacterium]
MKVNYEAIKKIVLLALTILILNQINSYSQLGFFSEYWQAKTAETPSFIEKAKPGKLPESVISVIVNDTIRKVSPYVGGYNLNTYYGGKIYDKPFLLENIRNLDLPFFRYPGGSGSNWYFWEHAKPNGPEDVDFMIIKDEVLYNKIKWGDEPDEDYLSLDNSYILRDSCQNEGIHVVNYSYARYGRSENPVQQAAHYAADWVRYDNGRTKFWEIGNEIYGSWEPGYIIDTSANMDGQPEQITGELYAQHSLVFLDSMRAAAAEIGFDIKIGAVLGFQDSRSDFDIPVLQILGDKVDFFSVHKYFGNGQDANPYVVLESIDEFYDQKTYIDNLINQYCTSYVPLIMTEWNTRYYGSYQNVSCTNGMHNLLGLKGIINEGIGVSCKWNLIWNFNDGETHGLISGEKENPSIEGIPTYSPRAPYFYMYHFKKFLGDVSVNNNPGQTDSIDIFSSAFHSGHSGIVLVNKAKTTKNIALNMDDYILGDKYYWYTLTSDDGNPFSRKVKINGQTSIEYDAGGPLNYHDIEAWSASTNDGIRLELPPFSATYVLTEGTADIPSEKINATFKVYENVDEVAIPLKNAIVNINKSFYMTNDNGEVVIPLSSGDYNYKIQKNAYDGITGAFNLTADKVIEDTLVVSSYSVTFNLSDDVSKDPIEGILVEIDGQTQQTNSLGQVNFFGLVYNSYDLVISSNSYNEKLIVDLYSDTIISLNLKESVYEVKFLVLDSYSDNPVGNCKVSINSEDKFTSYLGLASFQMNYDTYNYSLEKESYFSQNGIATINKDTTIAIKLVASTATIKFKLLDGNTPVNMADIQINSESFQTNTLGICYFNDLLTNQSYDYTITKDSYKTISGTIDLRTDTTLNLDFGLLNYSIEIQVIDKRKAFNIANSSVSFNGVHKSTDNNGLADFTVTPGTYEYSAEKDRYTTFFGNHTADSDTLFVISLDLSEAIIEFIIYNNSTPVNNASVEMNSENVLSNSLGMASFNNIGVDSDYQYVITKADYKTINSSVFVSYDSTINIELEIATSLNYHNRQISVYPNPVYNQIHIATNFPIVKIHITDVLGKMLLQNLPDDENKATIDLSGLNKGLYFISIFDKESNKLIRKILKNSI